MIVFTIFVALFVCMLFFYFLMDIFGDTQKVHQHVKMGNSFRRSGKKTQDITEKKNPNKNKLQKQRQRIVSERLHLDAQGDSLDDINAINDAIDNVTPRTKKRMMFEKMPSILNDLELRTLHVKPEEYSYPFENLVFEGGGNKGLAYCGAIRYLEEIEVYPQIKRLSGASAGAMTAALLAVGYNSYEIEAFLGQDLSQIFLDASWGYLSLLPNLIRGYGWNPGNRIYEWFGEALEKKTKDPDISFLELYRKSGIELCVVVTNLNHMVEEYCHPKTTPDMPVRLAVRMSMSIPGMFQATKYTTNGETNTYVDGGVLCNYPIHCYDGWWLSMKPNDSFLQRMQPLEALPELLAKNERFGGCNNSTLGFLLYADNEHEVFRFNLEQRIGTNLPELPDTTLARKKKKEIKIKKTVHREHRRVTNAVNEFLKVLQKHDIDGGGTISKEELGHAFADEEFSKESEEILFGKDCSVTQAFNTLDTDKDGEIEYHELINFVESTGVFLTQRYLGYQRKEIEGLVSFFDTLQNALLTNVKRIYVDDKDFNRTVGINTGHVGTSDFKLEEEDRRFVVEQGRRSIKSFLKYYVAKNHIQKRTDLPTLVMQPDSPISSNQIDVEICNSAVSNDDVFSSPNQEKVPMLNLESVGQ